MILQAKPPEINGEKSFLSYPVVAAATSSILKSVTNLSVNDLIVIGYPGNEKSEIIQITSVTTATKTIGHAALTFSHDVNALVQVIKYDQARFYKSTTETGTYSLLQTVDIDIDDEQTTYDYTSGLTTEYYKVAYYNSVTSTESQRSAALIGTGYTRKALYSILQEIRGYVGKRPSDRDIIRAINSAQDIICGQEDKWYFLYDSETYTTTASEDTYDLPDDFMALDRMDYTYNDGTSDTISQPNYFTHANFVYRHGTAETADDTVSEFTLAEASDEIIVSPPATATAGQSFTLYYWKNATPLEEYTDETVIPNPAAIVFWVASKMEASKKTPDSSRIYWQEYQQQLEAMSNRRKNGEKNFSVDI